MKFFNAIILIIFLLMAIVILSGCTSSELQNIPTPTPPTKFTTDRVSPASTTVVSTHKTINPLPITTRIIFPRPMTGTKISESTMNGGEGEFTIDNLQGGSDVVAILTYEQIKDPLTSVFIRSGEIYTIENIADGNYDLYIQYGSNWNPGEKRFEEEQKFKKFEHTYRFITTETTTETDTKIITKTKYTTWEVTLYTVSDGNVDTIEISEENSPKL